MTTHPIIDHSILSPSGRCSKRARKAALEREASRLFPPGYWDFMKPKPADSIESKRRAAATLRDLATRGMSARSFIRQADRLEREAADMEKAKGES